MYSTQIRFLSPHAHVLWAFSRLTLHPWALSVESWLARHLFPWDAPRGVLAGSKGVHSNIHCTLAEDLQCASPWAKCWHRMEAIGGPMGGRLPSPLPGPQ